MNYVNNTYNHPAQLANGIQPTLTPTALFSSAISALENQIISNVMTSINMDKTNKENVLLVSICKLVDKVAANDTLVNNFIEKEEKSQHNLMHIMDKRMMTLEQLLQHTLRKQNDNTHGKSMNIITEKLQLLEQHVGNIQNQSNQLNHKIDSIQNNLKHVRKDYINNNNQLNIINKQMQQIPRTSTIMHNINNSMKKINQKLDNSNKQTQKQIHFITQQIEMHSTELQEGLMAHSIAMQSIKDMLKFNKSPSINHIKTMHTAPNTEPTPTISTNAKPIHDSSSLNIDPAVDIISPKTSQSTVATIPPKTDGGSENIVFNNNSSITTNNQFNAPYTHSTPQIFNQKSIETVGKDTTIEKSIPAPNQPSLTKSVSSKTIHSAISNDNISPTNAAADSMKTLQHNTPNTYISKSNDDPTNVVTINNNIPPNKIESQHNNPNTPTFKPKHNIPDANDITLQSQTLDLKEMSIDGIKNELLKYLVQYKKPIKYNSNTQHARKLANTQNTRSWKPGFRCFHKDKNQLICFDEINRKGYKIDANLKTLATNPFSTACIIPSKGAIEKASNYKRGGNELYEEQEYDHAYLSYLSAIQLDPTNVIYKLNAAAAALKLESYEYTIYWCQDALLYAKDAENICKAYRRMGIAAEGNGNFSKCVEYYKKAQDEIFDSNIEKKIKSINYKYHNGNHN